MPNRAYGKWCDKQDLNLRPQSYQDCALPIELLSQKACCAGHLTGRLLHDKRTDDFLVAGSFRYQHTGYLFKFVRYGETVNQGCGIKPPHYITPITTKWSLLSESN
jgi:hypothetical protein